MKKQAYLVTVEANHRFQRLAKLAETDLCSNFTSGKNYLHVLHQSENKISFISRKSDGAKPFQPAHEIMALFVLCKLILQTRMRRHPVGLDA